MAVRDEGPYLICFLAGVLAAFIVSFLYVQFRVIPDQRELGYKEACEDFYKGKIRYELQLKEVLVRKEAK